jgi:hypothetical protein
MAGTRKIGWLGVPADDRAHGPVAYSIQQVFHVLELWSDAPEHLLEQLESTALLDLRPAEFGLQPARGFITEYPVYCALWAQPNNAEEEPMGRWAQASLVQSAWLLALRPQGLAPRHATLNRAGLSVRRILSREYTPFPYWSIPKPTSLKGYSDALEKLLRENESLPDREINLVRGLLALITDALRDRPPRLRTGSRRTGTTAQAGNLERQVDDPVFPHVVFEERRWQSPQQRQEAAAPVAETAAMQLMAIESSEGEDRLTPGQQIRRAKYRAEAIAVSGQGVMQASDRLQLVDLAALDQAAQALLDRPAWLPQDISHQAVAAVYLSLLTGRTIAQLSGLFVVRADALPEEGPPLILALDSWTVNSSGPDLPQSFEPDSGDRDLYHPITGRYSLPLPALRFADVAIACLDGSLAQQTVTRANLYPLQNTQQLQLQADRFLQHVNHLFNARTTSTRVAGFLRRQVHVVTRDWADAELLSGQRGAPDPRLYYYTPRVNYLRRIYQQVWAGVSLGLDPADKPRAPREDPWYEELRIGSQGTPLDSAVRAMVQQQMEICRNERTGRPGGERLRHAHNALTSYTLLMLIWHTGARAVDGMVDLTQYDPHSGFLGFSDKDGDDYADARVAWLPGMVQDQIRAYQRCTQALNRTRPLDFESDGSLFYLSKTWTHEPLTLKNIRRYLKQYRFRLNSQRHYLRTRLRELDVPGQAVDALLGHGSRGHEPYAQYSAYSPARLKADIAPALEKLGQMAGWAVIPAP